MSSKPGRLVVWRKRRAARNGERYIAEYAFPPHIERRVRRKAELDEFGWLLVERGLREWLICCAWRGRTVLGMPSRLVDEAWHEFILDSLSYTRFCGNAFGDYLHHTPDEAMTASTPMPDLLANTVRAWDRSAAGGSGESVLWDLDENLSAPQPLGVSGVQLGAARSRVPYPVATGWACAGALGGGCGGGGGGEGCGGGSGCGGGGCGGGCGGGS
jgi:hypothetical protein